MKANDLRDQLATDAELARALDDKRQELFNLRFQHATGALEIARLLTISHERAAEARKVQTS